MKMLQVGEKAPDFILPDQDGNRVQLSHYAQGGNVLMIFYTFDFTPV